MYPYLKPRTVIFLDIKIVKEFK